MLSAAPAQHGGSYPSRYPRRFAMSNQKIAERLAKLCREGQFETAQRELFADNAVSIEQQATPQFPKETHGLQAIIDKGHVFEGLVEQTHGCDASAPLVVGN